MTLDDTSTELVLPTYAILARFREPAETPDQAMAQVAARLHAQDEPVHEISVERDEGGGVWMVIARFVLVSIDAGTAVEGLHATLTSAGLPPDEVWADQQVG